MIFTKNTRKFCFISTLLTITIALGACQAVNDFNNMLGANAQNTADIQANTAETIIAREKSANCPSVQIMSDLQAMYQFTDFAEPTTDNKISAIKIQNVQANCTPKDEAVALSIDITFNGETGAKARQNSKDTANFSYPYFVAVTDANGEILAKEIFSAALSFSKGQDTVKQIETINQLLPKSSVIADYTVLLGFQLNEEQLTYNRINTEPAAGIEAPTEDNIVVLE